MRALLIITVALVAWIVVQQQAPMVDPKELAPPEEFVELNGLTLHFVHAGRGSPVVLLHGFGGWTYSWRANLPALAQAHAVYALDFPGFGLSDKPADYDYSLEAQAELVLAFLDHFGLERVALVGSSMGGGVAIELAVTHPERVTKLVLIDSVGFQAFRLPDWVQTLAQLPLSARIVSAFLPDVARVRYTLQWLYGNQARVSQEQVEEYYRPLRTPGAAEALVAMAKTLRLDSVKGRISQVKQPTLILWGEKDRLLPVAQARRFHHEIEHSQLVTFPDAGHVPYEEIPDRVNPLLLAFLKD